MPHAPNRIREALRVRIADIEGLDRPQRLVVPFGVPEIDRCLPGGGLRRGALHEIAGVGPEVEHCTAGTLLAAGVLARLEGTVLWALDRPDLFAPALACVGLSADRVIYAEVGKAGGALLVMEEGLRHRGLAGVVGEVSGRVSLTASRRLQLAAEASGVAAIMLRRSRRHDDPALSEPSAALTRWRVKAVPSPPPLAHAPETPGLARAVWQLDLIRCRSGEAASWIVEACDESGHLHLAVDSQMVEQTDPVRQVNNASSPDKDRLRRIAAGAR